jgi:hypothetical protein
MLSVDDFRKRSSKLFESCRTRWRTKLEKDLKKQKLSLALSADQILPFTRVQFHKWLWDQMGLQAIPCPFCRAPIDILSMELDHRTPLRRGGGPELQNLEPICRRCNSIKGELTREEYVVLIAFLEGPGAHFRQRLEGSLISGGLGKMLRHFPRKKGDKFGPTKKPEDQTYLCDLDTF